MCNAMQTSSAAGNRSNKMKVLSVAEVNFVNGGTLTSEWELLKAAGNAAMPYIVKAGEWLGGL
jgi:hypothetical protein